MTGAKRARDLQEEETAAADSNKKSKGSETGSESGSGSDSEKEKEEKTDWEQATQTKMKPLFAKHGYTCCINWADARAISKEDKLATLEAVLQLVRQGDPPHDHPHAWLSLRRRRQPSASLNLVLQIDNQKYLLPSQETDSIKTLCKRAAKLCQLEPPVRALDTHYDAILPPKFRIRQLFKDGDPVRIEHGPSQ